MSVYTAGQRVEISDADRSPDKFEWATYVERAGDGHIIRYDNGDEVCVRDWDIREVNELVWLRTEVGRVARNAHELAASLLSDRAGGEYLSPDYVARVLRRAAEELKTAAARR